MSSAAWIVGIHLLTQHAPGCPPGLHAVTPGLYAIAPNGATFGAFRNSYGHASAYAGWTGGAYGVDVTVGVLGYGKRVYSDRHATRLRPNPLLSPSVQLGAGFRLSYIPRFNGAKSAAHLSWETTL